MREKTCCFIGHRNIEVTDELVFSIKHILEMLIEEENVLTFAFGSKSDFNSLCFSIVTELKSQYPVIERVCLTCKSEDCCLEKDREWQEAIFSRVLKREVHLHGFERELEFKTKNKAGRASYVERNRAMIDISDFCMFYYNPNYKPPKPNSYSEQPKSGTALAFKYAQQKKKHIINMFPS